LELSIVRFTAAFRKNRVQRNRRLSLEPLESRCLMSASPLTVSVADFLASSYRGAIVGPAAPGNPPGGGGSQGGSTTDDFGNTFSTAYHLALNSSGGASIGGTVNSTSDIDMFSLTANLTGTMTVSVSSSGKNGVTAQLTIYDASGNVLATASGNSKQKSATCTLSVTSGSGYYIAVSGASGTIGSYTVNISTSVPAPPPAPALTLPSWLPGANDYSSQTAVTEQVVTTSGGQVLVVEGTSGADSIVVSQSGTAFTVTSAAGSQAVSGTFTGIAVYGFGGGDTIRLDSTVAAGISAVVYESGAVANTLSDAGMDTGYLYAGSGNDTLVSVGGGADLLTGGSGVCSFWCDSADSLAGTTSAETAAQCIHVISAFSQPTSTSNVTLQVDTQALPEPTAGVGYSSNFVNNPLWVDGPQYNDIRQGQVGDCYFLAGLSALADTDPGLLQQSIVALGDGSYAVRFYSGSTSTYWRVDATLPTNGGSPYYANLTPTGELWVPLLEKAFTQFREGQNSYSSISSGWMYEAYNAITDSSFSSFATTSSTADALAQTMANDLAAGHAVTAASLATEPGGSPIIAGHAYNVHSVTNVNGTWYVTVYNPWGFDGTSWDSNPSDGLLTLTSSQFQSWYGTVQGCMA
jgi:hypothetical protein